MKNYKSLETDEFIFFLTGPLSQWHQPNTFIGRLSPNGPLLTFNCAEQYMMAGKAKLFEDDKRLDQIMSAKHPRDQKEIGRAVGDFTKEQWEQDAAPIWNREAINIVFRGNWYRSLVCDDYAAVLDKSDHKMLVEGNPKDPIWAVGLSWDDPAIHNPANWRGTNWLGIAHMMVRAYRFRLGQLRLTASETVFNPWTRKFERTTIE